MPWYSSEGSLQYDIGCIGGPSADTLDGLTIEAGPPARFATGPPELLSLGAQELGCPSHLLLLAGASTSKGVAVRAGTNAFTCSRTTVVIIR
ncbi:UNVERIFIED_CONTAM: hypothetical protein Sradi_7054000 [Sesamum radiatum]|uniref:Uncharacterized protein n=1 Tax=Sesamum radiatum TaxID=300843 RepID=A0AAW2J6L2_SESRA